VCATRRAAFGRRPLGERRTRSRQPCGTEPVAKPNRLHEFETHLCNLLGYAGAGDRAGAGLVRWCRLVLVAEACDAAGRSVRWAKIHATMDDREAIEHYDRAGEKRRGAFSAVRWPDLALDAENLARLAEGVFDARCDCVRLAFGDAVEGAALGERLSEAWRTDALHVRYAPEGVFLRTKLSVLLEIAPEDDDVDADESSTRETLMFEGELCVSFTSRHHTRPFVDFMGGSVRRMTDGASTRLDPFAHEIAPAEAVAWGLNGA
jgi:hypothetical protein